MEYRGYKIEPNNTGYVNFDFYLIDSELISGHGKTIEDCVKQIDELLNEECPQLKKMDKLVHDNLVEICKQYPNDQELGQQVRKLFNK